MSVYITEEQRRRLEQARKRGKDINVTGFVNVTVVNWHCLWCDEPVDPQEAHVQTCVYGEQSYEVRPIHPECSFRQGMGSAGHILGTCSCYGGTEGDPPGMTKREAAREARRLWTLTHGQAGGTA